MEDVEQPPISTNTFKIETEVYSGPLDLLIELIERRKLLVNDISVASVTDDYMRYVALMEQNPLRETAQFVVLAATLLLIKSKSLLPILDLTSEEEESVENLETRLKLYQIYRNAGKVLALLFGTKTAYERQFVASSEPLFLPDSFTEVGALKAAMQDVLLRLPKKVEKPKVQVRKTVSLEEMIDKLATRIERQLSLTFKDFTGASSEKTTVIVGFLAVLEMVKQGSVIVRQAARYSDFEIEREGNGAPRYL